MEGLTTLSAKPRVRNPTARSHEASNPEHNTQTRKTLALELAMQQSRNNRTPGLVSAGCVDSSEVEGEAKTSAYLLKKAGF